MRQTLVNRLKKIFARRRANPLVDPDEMFFDAHNLSSFRAEQFEGRLERPIGKRSLYGLLGFFFLTAAVFGYQIWGLQIAEGAAYREKSEKNRLKHTLIFAERGRILDRRGVELAWNVPRSGDEVSERAYTALPGFGHLLGYVSYPQKDRAGNYFSYEFEGKDGVEKEYAARLGGENGIKITETDVHGVVESESVLEPPVHGEDLTLSVDAEVQSVLYKGMEELAGKVGFEGGAAVIMDVHTGELLAMTSYPEYKSQVLSDGEDREEIARYNSSKSSLFLNRVAAGVYTPGSIVKPFVAAAALTEGIIDPAKQILSTGSISIPNPYVKGKDSVFSDWKAHGWVDMRHAIAVSSNVYFYEVGGGYKDQAGLGISRLEKYFRMFGFGEGTGIDLPSENVGTIPNPEWKARNFDGEPWRLGDTYFTSIGQYGMQVTPLQAVRAIAAVANGGSLRTPSVAEGNHLESVRLPLDPKDLQIVREGMRMGALEGTARALNVPYVQVAGKTGTAELGVSKEKVNSWVMGFFPYEAPRYAFIVMMEKGPRQNLTGAAFVMRGLLDWMSVHRPEYLKAEAVL